MKQGYFQSHISVCLWRKVWEPRSWKKMGWAPVCDKKRLGLLCLCLALTHASGCNSRNLSVNLSRNLFHVKNKMESECMREKMRWDAVRWWRREKESVRFWASVQNIRRVSMSLAKLPESSFPSFSPLHLVSRLWNRVTHAQAVCWRGFLFHPIPSVIHPFLLPSFCLILSLMSCSLVFSSPSDTCTASTRKKTQEGKKG